MTATLPLEISPSLRLVLVGDTGVGKSKATSLFLSSVPGQVSPNDPTQALDNLSLEDSEGEDNDDNNNNSDGNSKGDTEPQKQAETDSSRSRGVVSTLQVPTWLKVQANSSSADTMTGEVDDEGSSPAENIVLHDFVGYGQVSDANQTIDRVDAFLIEQYSATRNLFGPAITPLSSLSTAPASNDKESKQPSFLEQLLVDSTMAHSLPDACLYFILYDLKPVDIIFMKRIMHHVNLIPVLAKADTLSVNQLWKAKSRILKQLQDNDIDFFQFGFTIDELKEMAAEKLAGGPPFALSTAQLEADFLISSPATSLTELAQHINEGKFANTRSDLSLLQTLLLGSKNRMLHQAAVRKFLNSWKKELDIPLEEPSGTAPVANNVPSEASPVEDSTQVVSHNVPEQAQTTAKSSPSTSPTPHAAQTQQQGLDQVAQQPTHDNPQQQLPQQTVAPQEVQSIQTKPLPAILQQPTYQPTSSYSTYLAQQAQAIGTDDEVGQVIKLNRQRSFIRAASPSTKIYTQGTIVPPVPLPPSSLGAVSTAPPVPSSPSQTPAPTAAT